MSGKSSRSEQRPDGMGLPVDDDAQRRERRSRREVPGAIRAASTGSVDSVGMDRERPARSVRQNSAPASNSEINHQDEIERIREMRARRLRKERGETSEPIDSASNREKRSDRQFQRQVRPSTAATAPTKSKSTPIVSRREIDKPGPEGLRTERRSNDVPVTRREDDSSVYSRSRRERVDRLSTDDDVLSAYSRARRERVTTEDDTQSSYSRTRRDKVRNSAEDDSASVQSRLRRENLTMDDESSTYGKSRRERSKDRDDEETLSVYSRNSEKSNARQTSFRKVEQDISPERRREQPRKPPSRSKTGGDDLRLLAANRAGEKRHPPVRAKSADQDLLNMDLNRRNKEETKGARKRSERDSHPDRTKSTDLTTRLRERREARAAEREIKSETKNDEEGSTDRLVTEVERRLARRRSNDDLDVMTNATLSSRIETLGTLPSSDLQGDLPNAGKGNDNGIPSFSIKIRTLSAIDLPHSVVANMPLCPVVKIGLIPDHSVNEHDELQGKLQMSSIDSICSSRVRSTTSKIMGKRDNGTIDFYQEMRWDGLPEPTNVALVVEIAARAVRVPTNYHQSPLVIEEGSEPLAVPKSPEPTKRIHTIAAAAATEAANNPKPSLDTSQAESQPERTRNLQRNASGSDDDLTGGLRALWRKATNRKAAELEAAEAAAAVARMLVEQERQPSGTAPTEAIDEVKMETGIHQMGTKFSLPSNTEYNVSLRKGEKEPEHWSPTEDARLGTLVIPLSQLLPEKSLVNFGRAKVDKWFQLNTVLDEDLYLKMGKQPSVRLEISCSQTITMNETEDSLEVKVIHDISPSLKSPNTSITQHPVEENKDDSKDEPAGERSNTLDPVLEPGVIDFIAMVGCRDIGNQQSDNGATGWVDTSPECTILEQFPHDNEFHIRNGRKALLPEMVQWFCFPEGVRLWRGLGPPSHADLNLKRFSASSPPNVASSIAAFDASLNCTTSFSWFVIASNSDEYGSKLVKTYGAVIRFYAPAPIGVDPNQEDYAHSNDIRISNGASKRLWVPMGICLTSNLPIVGILEAILLRLCEELSAKVEPQTGDVMELGDVHDALAKIIVQYQKPIAGAVNCSVPFLSGERFLLSLPPPTGLPALPHGKAVVATCRLLGTEGLNFFLSAVLTECKILIHSHDISDIPMVAEVVTALIYPFSWSLPYIPILPVGMLEFVEAPLSYILGVPSHSLRLVDRHALDDVVVIDLDNISSTRGNLGSKRSKVGASKFPPPLPSQVAANISKAVFKLLRAEEEVDIEYGMSNIGDHTLPRLEGESLAEREFRVSVAMEICGLLRGYQDCTGPVFNRDKFLKTAHALFEDRRDHKGIARSNSQGRVISPRSKRFLSLLVNTQNFHQFIESPESDEAAFFHEIIDILEDPEKVPTRSGDTNVVRSEKSVAYLVKTLQKNEDKIPTYQVEKYSRNDDVLDKDNDFYLEEDGDDLLDADFGFEPDTFSSGDPDMTVSFTKTLLVPIANSGLGGNQSDNLIELHKERWHYKQVLHISQGCKAILEFEKRPLKLREAIGDQRYLAWKIAQDQTGGELIDKTIVKQNVGASTKQGIALDLTTLVSSASTNDATDELSARQASQVVRQTASTPEQQRIVDAKDRDIIRRCLDRAHGDKNTHNPFLENGRDLLAESEKALRNPSAQRFLLSILSQRSRMENQRLRGKRRQSASQQASISRLDPVAFSCLVRLCCAILDSCMEYKEYETAYQLLTLAAGFITLNETTPQDESAEKETAGHQVVTMTSSIGWHPIFANLAVWKTVWSMHLADRRSEKKSEARPAELDSDEDADEDEDEIEYESAVATLFDMHGYDVPGEELSRFAMRISEDKGWFSDDRGRQLLMLARRITLRRDTTDVPPLVGDSCIEMMGRSQNIQDNAIGRTYLDPKATLESQWNEISWCHPAAPTSQTGSRSNHSQIPDNHYMKRSPITALASFGHSVVVTGGLDGGVFLAYSVRSNGERGIRGVHLDWGSASRAGASSSSDGEYGVGQ